jgi:hypothetical protein
METIATSPFGTCALDDNAPLWRYVTKMDKSNGSDRNLNFRCNYYQEIYKGLCSRVKAHLLKISYMGRRGCPKVTIEQ